MDKAKYIREAKQNLKLLDGKIKVKLLSERVVLKRITMDDITKVLSPCVASHRLIERATVLFGFGTEEQNRKFDIVASYERQAIRQKANPNQLIGIYSGGRCRVRSKVLPAITLSAGSPRI